MGLEKNKVNRSLGIALIILIVAFAAVILLQVSSVFLGPSKNACTKKVCLAKFLEGPPAFNDERLKAYLREKYYYDSNGPPNYSEKVGYNSTFEQTLDFITTYFENKKGGTFAVLGAGDGEFQDITLPLEKNLGWSGLLIEPQPELFQMMKQKGRTATLSNNCVSPFAYPARTLLGHHQVNAVDSTAVKFNKYRGTKVKQLFEDDTDITGFSVQCVPLENLLYAAGIEKTLDLMVLDMNGSDLDILVNVKMDILPDIQMMVVMSNGNDFSTDIGGYFLDKNLVLKKIFGKVNESPIFVLAKFKAEDDL